MQTLNERGFLWVERNLLEAHFYLDEKIKKQWLEEDKLPPSFQDKENSDDEIEDEGKESSTSMLFEPDEFAAALRMYWPQFVYFDSFQDSLPRQITVNDILTPVEPTDDDAGNSKFKIKEDASHPVRDLSPLVEWISIGFKN